MSYQVLLPMYNTRYPYLITTTVLCLLVTTVYQGAIVTYTGTDYPGTAKQIWFRCTPVHGYQYPGRYIVPGTGTGYPGVHPSAGIPFGVQLCRVCIPGTGYRVPCKL